MKFEPVIGLEIHAQLATNSKMFCSCANEMAKKPNENVCPVCLGLPGALPRINARAVDFAIALGLATHSRIRQDSVFSRKHYFYPDLPKAYQISQFDKPVCEGGWVEIDTEQGKKRIGITRIHMEEDAGKLVHEGQDPSSSYVDFNRAGVPLLEIVSEAELRTAEEAKAYMEKIYTLVTALKICRGDMEKGNLRCDANISIRPLGSNLMNTRTETKNLNSFRFVKQAIESEIARQIDLVLDGKEVVQETRLFDSVQKKTYSMRKKEDAHDYRYFDCPDLPVVEFSKEKIEQIRAHLPELPEDKKQRFIQNHQLSDYDAGLLSENSGFADFFEQTVQLGADPKKTANWLLGELSKLLNDQDAQQIKESFQPQQLKDLIDLVQDGTISNKIAKELFVEVYNQGVSPKELIAKKGLEQISDERQLRALCEELVLKHPAEVQEFKKGKDKVLGFFVGQMMAKTKGKANPKILNQILLELMR